jgi:hypothetical protein
MTETKRRQRVRINQPSPPAAPKPAPLSFRWMSVVPSPSMGKVDKWKVSAALASDGRIFMPAAAMANEMQVFLCAGYDGTPIVYYLKHAYVPTDWAKREFPKEIEIIAKIERKVLEAFAEEDA